MRWRDPQFDVVQAALPIVHLSKGEHIHACSISDLYYETKLCCFAGGKNPLISANDIQQDGLGDCWLLSALGAIAENDPTLIKDCVIGSWPEHDISVIQILGYHIAVDHTIPVIFRGDKAVRTLSPSISDEGEYWAIIIEKAFVKFFSSPHCPIEIKLFNNKRRISKNYPLNGMPCYMDIHGGFPRWVFSCMYACQIEPLATASQQKRWVKILSDTECLACACTSSEQNDSVYEDGFVYGHAYSILSVDEKRSLIRVRNPWGEYESTRYDDGVDDGSFWVDEEDFRRRFPVVCLLKLRRSAVIDVA